jgi:Sigma-70 region 2
MSFRDGSGHTGMTISSDDHRPASDEAAFTEQVQRHRRELHVHCYRMLGSFDDCEDLVQETFPARLAQQDLVRRPVLGAGVAVQDRDQRLPGCP